MGIGAHTDEPSSVNVQNDTIVHCRLLSKELVDLFNECVLLLYLVLKLSAAVDSEGDAERVLLHEPVSIL